MLECPEKDNDREKRQSIQFMRQISAMTTIDGEDLPSMLLKALICVIENEKDQYQLVSLEILRDIGLLFLVFSNFFKKIT